MRESMADLFGIGHKEHQLKLGQARHGLRSLRKGG